MNIGDWRQLIEAFLEGRLSAEAFARRFIEAWNGERRSGAAIPRAIAELQAEVEAFASQIDGRDEGAVDSDSLLEAARRTLANLGEEIPISAGPTYDRARAREEMRRMQIQVSGCAGAGCLVAVAWIALSLLQIYYVSEQIQNATGWGAWPSAVIGFVLAFVPVIGNLLAFFGATGEGWPMWLAAIVFFAAPAATLFSGWTRWRQYRR